MKKTNDMLPELRGSRMGNSPFVLNIRALNLGHTSLFIEETCKQILINNMHAALQLYKDHTTKEPSEAIMTNPVNQDLLTS